jgi:hypothetical protein
MSGAESHDAGDHAYVQTMEELEMLDLDSDPVPPELIGIETPCLTPRHSDATESWGAGSPGYDSPSLGQVFQELPQVPPLPQVFPSTPPNRTGSFDVLNDEAAQRQVAPRLNLDSMTECSTPASPYLTLPSGNVLFGFTLRKADGLPLGMEVDPGDGRYLLVKKIHEGGAIFSWNWLCADNGQPQHAQRMVLEGDRIISINSRMDTQGMLEECQKHLLKILIWRGDGDCDLTSVFWEASYGWSQ